MAVFLGSPPASGENVEPSPFSMVNSTIPLPLSLQIRKKHISYLKNRCTNAKPTYQSRGGLSHHFSAYA